MHAVSQRTPSEGSGSQQMTSGSVGDWDKRCWLKQLVVVVKEQDALGTSDLQDCLCFPSSFARPPLFSSIDFILNSIS